MFTHILCPTDLKERALLALKKALQIAHQFNSKIYPTKIGYHHPGVTDSKSRKDLVR